MPDVFSHAGAVPRAKDARGVDRMHTSDGRDIRERYGIEIMLPDELVRDTEPPGRGFLAGDRGGTRDLAEDRKHEALDDQRGCRIAAVGLGVEP
jgi:hypothetical protein